MADTAAVRSRPLDEVMLAMDVVDTLRHRQTVVAQELEGPERDEALLARLRQIYAAQGIEVSDRILHDGVAALREDRFAYRPPPDDWRIRLARIYVERGRWGKRLLGVVIALAIGVGAYQFAIVAPRDAISAEIERTHAAIGAVAVDEGARLGADTLHARGRAAIAAGDTRTAQATLAELGELQASLERSYSLLVVIGPDVVSGVWRVPDMNVEARNHYLIVEAVDERGGPVALPVRSEETGRIEQVTTFGLRVDEATWNRVAADLEDDGIIQERLVAVKRPGVLEPEYLVETTGGTITRW
ncbi:MAG: hypothetical protein H0U69_00740 [Trueperaceae bacterium]|nr:hypothetical protein [Trueperaceae bacterium]